MTVLAVDDEAVGAGRCLCAPARIHVGVEGLVGRRPLPPVRPGGVREDVGGSAQRRVGEVNGDLYVALHVARRHPLPVLEPFHGDLGTVGVVAAACPRELGDVEALDVRGLLDDGTGGAAVGRQDLVVGGQVHLGVVAQQFGPGLLVDAVDHVRLVERRVLHLLGGDGVALEGAAHGDQPRRQPVAGVLAEPGEGLPVVVAALVLAVGRDVAPVVVGHADGHDEAVAVLRSQLGVGVVALDLGGVRRLGLGGQHVGGIGEVVPPVGVVRHLGVHEALLRVRDRERAAGRGMVRVAVPVPDGVGVRARPLPVRRRCAVLRPVPAQPDVLLRLVGPALDVSGLVAPLLARALGEEHLA